MVSLKKISTVILYFAFVAVLQAQSTICWDTSLSMEDRDLEKDFSILEKVFERNKNQEVQVLFFNMTITEKTYQITDGSWQALKEDLLNVNYDGGTLYSKLGDEIKHSNVYVFTDGKNNISSDILSLKPKSILINSNKSRNVDFLNKTVLLTKSRLMDFASLLPENKKDSKINQEDFIEGTIYIDNQPASNISVSAVNGSEVYLTDSKGNFRLKAKVGDSILVSSVSNKTYKILEISSKNDTNVFLEPNIYTLDEVVLVEKKREERFIYTASGKQNKDKLGYAVQSIDDEAITTINTTVSSAVQGKFSGVSYGSNQDLSQLVIRGGANSILGNNYGLVVVDGVPLRQSNSATGAVSSTDFIDPENIADITILKSLAATNRFGSLGKAGAVLITTKTGLAAQGRKSGGNSALVKNNVFDGKLNVKNSATRTLYIEELKKGDDFNSSYAIYLNQRSAHKNESVYFIDVYDYFKPMNGKIATQIATNVLEKENVSYKQLRTLFIKAIKNKDNILQDLVSIKMLEDYPEKIQSYYDKALAYKNNGEYQKALDTFLGIVDGSASYGLNFSGLHKRVKTEIKDLIYHHKTALDTSEIPVEYLKNEDYKARLVFDWNNSNSEFELQFVNPQNRFFEWKHNNFESKERIEDEIKHGFSSEQFELIGDESKGKWIINVSYLGDLNNQITSTPTFIKCRIDYNYGTANSHSQEYVLRLTEVSDKQFFFEFTL